MGDTGRGGGPLQRARAYLERFDVEATYVSGSGPVGAAIREAVRDHGCDAVFMGSYTFNRWLEDVVGGILEQVLLECDVPTLVT